MKLKDLISPFNVWKRAAQKPYTVQDPIKDRPGAGNYRGFHQNDFSKCIGCGSCEEICQNAAIDLVEVEGQEAQNGDSGLRPLVDYGRYCWCALCVDVCPTSALTMSNEYNWVDSDPEVFRFVPGADKKSWDEDKKGYRTDDGMELLQFERIKMPVMAPDERKDTFMEMVHGYSKELAMQEAERCIECGVCVSTCPAHMDIPEYIKAIREDDIENAVRILYETNPFSASCGRVCSHMCETSCALTHKGEAIAIRWLKRYILDQVSQKEMAGILNDQVEENGKKIAVVGGGPGGLSAAYYLRLLGYQVTVFEKKEFAGGMLRYGIPEYRLPYDELDKDINHITSIGVDIRTNTQIGKDIKFDKIMSDFDAVYLSSGLENPMSIRCEGEELPGVVGGVDFLRDITNGLKPEIGEKVVIIGGGNVAMDVARTSVRLGKDVTVMYRRRLEDMPADQEEIDEAIEEGITFKTQAMQTKIEKSQNGRLLIHWNNMKMMPDPGKSRPKPVPIEGDVDKMEIDTVFSAVGQNTDFEYIPKKIIDKLKFKWGKVITNEFGQTAIPKVFAGGDIHNFTADAVSAIGEGHMAAKGIDDFLKK